MTKSSSNDNFSPKFLKIISGIHHSVPLQLRHSMTPEQMAFEECPNITERKLEGKFRGETGMRSDAGRGDKKRVRDVLIYF